jgi:hypothetical protein
MATTYSWYESYKAALLETDWTKMQERIGAAECQLHKRQRVLSEDRGGTLEERQAIADALNGTRCLRTEHAESQNRHVPGGESSGIGTD